MCRHMRMSLACALAIGMVPMMGKAEDPGGGDPLKLKATADDVTELGRIKPEAHIALQQERDKLADDLVRLGNYLKQAGFTSEDGGPLSDVDIAIHHLGLKAGYQSSLEASAGIIDNFQSQIERLGNHILAVSPDAVEGSAVDTAIKLIDDRKELQLALETAQARAKREAEEVAAPVPDLSPALQLQHPVEEIEGVLNTHFRTGGDAVIELHNATGRLKAAVRQVALIEAATSPKAA
ncbi:hypothetical protein [Asticcacaulis taihuensis]|uniref:hypothetical protein n=1 Tax=Asticcacaulis taihuensis TaxID=260084 RepID=UPI0026EB315B|nr:hypothetical protein [Asticcacaulis taihuensis]